MAINMTTRIITGPVYSPNTPDCDYHNGEKPLTKQQINHLQQSFKNYNIIDFQHQFANPISKWNLKNIAKPLKSWISKKEHTYTDILGNQRTVPAGTWWLSIEIHDPEIIEAIDQKKLTAYSLTTANKDYADKIMNLLPTSIKTKKSVMTDEDIVALISYYSQQSNKHRTLIRDIIDPVAFTVSVTDMPCMKNSMFCIASLSSQKRDNGDIMNEETFFETLSKKFDKFFSQKSETLPTNVEEPKYMTEADFDSKIKANNETLKTEIGEEVAKIIDEKTTTAATQSQAEPTGGEAGEGTTATQTNQGEAGTGGEAGEGAGEATGGEQGQTEAQGAGEGETATSQKSQPQSRQIEDPFPNHRTSRYSTSKLYKDLGRRTDGTIKFKF